MKAYRIGDQSGLGSLTATDLPDPLPAPGEAVIRPRLVCLNYRDMMVLSGSYGPKKVSDRIPVSEGVGEVIAIGAGVSNVAVGDRVICPHFVTWLDGPYPPAAFATDIGITHDGWLAEQVCLPAAALVRVPDTLSDEQAAALPLSALTAWNALVEVGRIRAGDTVLTLGTGGVSVHALQIAKAAGARVAITSSSDEKLALARTLGADICINYRSDPDWASRLMAETDGYGADIVVETGGQATVSQSIGAAAVNGQIVIIGALAVAANREIPNYRTIIEKNLALRGIAGGSRAMLVRLVKAVAANGLAAHIDRVFAFDAAPAAYAHLQSGAHVGKVMIKVA